MISNIRQQNTTRRDTNHTKNNQQNTEETPKNPNNKGPRVESTTFLVT